MISALTGDGINDFKQAVAQRLPESPWLYPEDQISDAPLRFLAAEVTREQLFLQLHQEVPYATMVETENWEEFQDGSLKISQVVHVQREGQKAIVLGKGGTRIRSIRLAAQSELEAMLRPARASLLVREAARDLDRRPNSLPGHGFGFRGVIP